ncbi:MAG: hypothetical protein MZU91_08400 [Desulfosudis oleivorans]|nr:hypothetical protein [Desulfosudis oleivorans]
MPAEILSKPSRLNRVEYELIKEHAQTGYDILKGIRFPWPVATMVLAAPRTARRLGLPERRPGRRDPARVAHPRGRRRGRGNVLAPPLPSGGRAATGARTHARHARPPLRCRRGRRLPAVVRLRGVRLPVGRLRAARRARPSPARHRGTRAASPPAPVSGRRTPGFELRSMRHAARGISACRAMRRFSQIAARRGPSWVIDSTTTG